MYKFLLASGAKLDLKDPQILSSFFYCASWKHLDVLEDLLKRGLNPDYLYEGTTPLIEAASSGNLSVVKALIKYKADKYLKNKDGETAFDLAESQEIQKILEADKLKSG